MIRPLPQAALCFILCPLLAAQQAVQAASPAPTPSSQPAPAPAYVTLPVDTKIELMSPGPTEFAKVQSGAFVVDKDVFLAGVPMIHAGAPVAGILDHVKRGSHSRHRDREMEIRVTEMISGEQIELHLRCFEPADAAGGICSCDENGPGFNPDKDGIIAGLALVVIGIIAFALHKEK